MLTGSTCPLAGVSVIECALAALVLPPSPLGGRDPHVAAPRLALSGSFTL